MSPVSEKDSVMVQKEKLNQADCLCPICLEIFLEPVTLPCTHTFCKPCFLETVDKANICCPLCRKRVSTWARLNGRNKTLVNTELWRRIQDAFPTQCQCRLSGVDEEDVNIFIPKPKVCQPGELRREYEEEINKFVEEKRALEEAERKASEEYIQRLLAEEEERVEEERRRQEERQLEDDEKLARLLSEELNSSPILETQRNVKVNDAAKKKNPKVGHIEKYLCQVPYTPPHCETKQSSTLLDNKENILNTSPSIGLAGTELHFLDSVNQPSTSSSDPDTGKQLFDTSSRINVCSKRKSGDESELVTRKKPCNSPPPASPPPGVYLQQLAEQEEVLKSRMQQEEEDRRIALRLQKELNQENAVDRRKGSADGYLLREKGSPPSSSSSSTSTGKDNKAGKASPHSSRQKVDGHKAGKRSSSKVESKSTRKSPVSTQVSPSVSSIQKSRKQTRLTDIFSSLGT